MAWTLIDLDTSWQDLPIAVQIWDQYDRRQRVLADLHVYPEGSSIVGHIVDPVPEPDSDVTVFDFILQMQQNIERMAMDIWIDPGLDLVTIYNNTVPPALDDPTHLPWTEAELMEAAGLTAAGYWRRIAEEGDTPTDWEDYEDPAFVGNYGQIVSKDMAGPWLFRDMQLVLDKMTRTYLVGEASASQPYESNTTEIADWEADHAWGACDTNDDIVLDAFTGFMNPHVIPSTSLVENVFSVEKYRIDGETSVDPDTGFKYAFSVTGPITVVLSAATQAYVSSIVPIIYKQSGYYYWLCVEGIGCDWAEEAGFYRGWETQDITPAVSVDISPSDLSITDCTALKAYADTKMPDDDVAIQPFPGEEHDRKYEETARLECIIADFNFWA